MVLLDTEWKERFSAQAEWDAVSGEGRRKSGEIGHGPAAAAAPAGTYPRFTFWAAYWHIGTEVSDDTSLFTMLVSEILPKNKILVPRRCLGSTYYDRTRFLEALRSHRSSPRNVHFLRFFVVSVLPSDYYMHAL